MALRLEDEDPRISNLVKLFFHELSKKGSNPIYNLLPDILSRLSCQNMSEETFCNIMQFLIDSIKKDKQMEGLIEKLCHRFSGITDKKQWVDIAYCLSQLTYTEKGFKKLADLFKSYEHALSEDAVIDYFKSISNKAKKFAKPEVKSFVEDFEVKLVKCHEERKELEITAQNAMAHQQKLSGQVEMEKSNSDETSCETKIDSQEDGVDKEDVGSSKNTSQESTRGDATEDIESHESIISEPGDTAAPISTSGESHLENDLSPSATKSCRKGRSRKKPPSRRNPKLEVPITEEEGEFLDIQPAEGNVQPGTELPDDNSSVSSFLHDNIGEIVSKYRPASDNEQKTETTPLKTDLGDTGIKGLSRRKKTVHLKLPAEESEGSVIDEEKENNTKQIPQTRSSHKTRQQRETITSQTRTLRRR